MKYKPYRAGARLQSRKHWQALKDLATALDAAGENVAGQRGPGQSPLLDWLAETAMAGQAELVAALRIARWCAVGGGDWSEAIDFIRPEWPED